MKSFKEFSASLSEALWPGTKEYKDKYGTTPKGIESTKGNLHDIDRDSDKGVTKVTRRVDKSTGLTTEPKKKVDVVQEPKRGRGRPPGKYGPYKKKVKESLDIIEGLETEEEIQEFIESLDEESFLELQDFVESADSEDAEEVIESKGDTKPGWMLRADPALAKKVKDKQDTAKAREKSYGDPAAGKSK